MSISVISCCTSLLLPSPSYFLTQLPISTRPLCVCRNYFNCRLNNSSNQTKGKPADLHDAKELVSFMVVNRRANHSWFLDLWFIGCVLVVCRLLNGYLCYVMIFWGFYNGFVNVVIWLCLGHVVGCIFTPTTRQPSAHGR